MTIHDLHDLHDVRPVHDIGGLPYLRTLDIRRAILGVFLRAGTPLTIDQVLLALADEGLDLEGTQHVSARQRVSDVMRHQVRMGRATVVGRGTFSVDAREFSESTRYRCLHWRQVAVAEAIRREERSHRRWGE